MINVRKSARRMVMLAVGSLTALTLAGVALAAPVVDGEGNTAAPEIVDIAEKSADLTPTVGSTSEGKKEWIYVRCW